MAARQMAPAARSDSTVERAFALARNGECRTIEDIRRQLRLEQCDNVDAHLSGPTVRRQLLDLCLETRRGG